MVALYTTEVGQYEGATHGGKNQYETIHAIWKQLYQEGTITEVNNTSTLFQLFNMVPSDPFISHLATQLGYSAGEFQAL